MLVKNEIMGEKSKKEKHTLPTIRIHELWALVGGADSSRPEILSGAEIKNVGEPPILSAPAGLNL